MPEQVNFFTLLFADDTTLQDMDSNLLKLTNRSNYNIKLAAEWFQTNRLTLNTKKTKCMLFGPNNNSLRLPISLKIQGVNIEKIRYRFPVKSFKLVGVILDDYLNWGEH